MCGADEDVVREACVAGAFAPCARTAAGSSSRCYFRTRRGPVRRWSERRNCHREESGNGEGRTVTTDAAGNQSPFARAGAARGQGRKTSKASVRTGINLEVGQDAVVSLRLELGEIAQAVTVSEMLRWLIRHRQLVSGMVGEQAVKKLPLNGRSFDNLITLNPGAINYTAMKSANTTSDGNGFSVAGRRPGDNLSCGTESNTPGPASLP